MGPTAYMRRCLELAEIARSAGDTAVGALIVRGDDVVGEGFEQTRATHDPSAHAEVIAIRQACRRLGTLDLRRCSLYSTVEPCVLCGYAIRRAGIAAVIYGVPAGQAGAWMQWQPGWKAAQRMQVKLADGNSMRKKTVVALARQLAIDLWRWRTGRCTLADLGWVAA